MILCDREVMAALKQGRILIHPSPDLKYMDSTATDLLLDGTLDKWKFDKPDESVGQVPYRFRPGKPGFKFSDLEKYTEQIDISTEPYNLDPQGFILGWTVEKIYLPHESRLCARVEGKSSLGRMGVGVHVTAPTIHAGFGYNKNDANNHGARLRLEIWNVGPIPVELVKGMRVCQLIIEEVREVPSTGYSGNFNMQGPKSVA